MINVIICAAGISNRFGANKLLEKYGKSVVLTESIRPFLEIDDVEKIIVSANEDDIELYEKTLQKQGFPTDYRIAFCTGGETRSESVYNALDYLTDNANYVLIHDGARPNVSVDLIKRVIAKLDENVCVIPTVDLADTLYTKDLSLKDRNDYVLAQTPQGFPAQLLCDAYDDWFEEKKPFTDDFSLVQHYRRYATFTNVKGDANNVKITYRQDLNKVLTGIGYDIHNYDKVPNNSIPLCGVQIPANKKAIAHSDGDVPLHALMDAILSAIGEKDIGHMFPVNDDKYKDISSLVLLDSVMDLVKKKGYIINNVSIAIILEKPKIAEYIDEMKNVLSAHLSLDKTSIGITATTNEGSGLVGSGDAIAALANVSLY